MKILIVVFLCLCFSCGAAVQEPVDLFEHSLPEPLYLNELPEPVEEVPFDERMVLPVAECVIEDTEPPEITPPGILMSQSMAIHAARLRVAYDEIRGLYEVDLRTMDREREIYDRHLKAADIEIAEWRVKARRSWWEKNKGTVALVVGVVAGAALTISVAAAIDEATE